MNGLEAVGAVSSATPASELSGSQPIQTDLTTSAKSLSSFADFIAAGLGSVEAKVDHANEMAKAFVLDESVPIHQVTMAIEEARMAVELTMQVRSRLVEGYREIMNMQL